MFRIGARRFATTAMRAAETAAQMEAPNQYGISVSKAHGVVKGLTGGMLYPSKHGGSSNAVQQLAILP
jgi:cysteine synthase A